MTKHPIPATHRPTKEITKRTRNHRPSGTQPRRSRGNLNHEEYRRKKIPRRMEHDNISTRGRRQQQDPQRLEQKVTLILHSPLDRHPPTQTHPYMGDIVQYVPVRILRIPNRHRVHGWRRPPRTLSRSTRSVHHPSPAQCDPIHRKDKLN